ncbi:MAG: DHH family phosphoesterase [Desulfobacterales bacterium]
MKFSAAERLRRFYGHFAGEDHVLIMIYADPDSIARDIALKRLLCSKVANVSIAKINTIKRPDNLAMIRLLGVKLVNAREVDPYQFNRLVMVDSQPGHHEDFEGLKPDVVIDHHPETDFEAPFKDVRPKYGATATIITEYLKAARIKPSVKLATGLFHAIKTDTQNFERQALIEDMQAFQFLFRHANLNLAWKIEHAELKAGFLKYFKIALKEMRLRKGWIFSHLGNVANPDICVILADFFMKVDAVTWSLVSGIYNKKLILIFRNDGLRKDAGNLAQKSFGYIGSAGGHKSMARAEISISDLKDRVDHKDNAKMLAWIIQNVQKKPVPSLRGKQCKNENG